MREKHQMKDQMTNGWGERMASFWWNLPRVAPGASQRSTSPPAVNTNFPVWLRHTDQSLFPHKSKRWTPPSRCCTMASPALTSFSIYQKKKKCVEAWLFLFLCDMSLHSRRHRSLFLTRRCQGHARCKWAKTVPQKRLYPDKLVCKAVFKIKV